MRSKEFLTEYRTRMFRYVKSVLPKWPDYVLKDWIYGLARGNHPKPAGQPSFNKEDILSQVEYEGLSPDTEWKLVPNMEFTLDMFEPKTKKWLISRLGGDQKEIHHSAREQDKKRHITQAQLAKKEGGVRKEPVLLIKHNDGYVIREGWHRTVQHFNMYPDGYTGPAYVAVAQGQQGMAEAPLHNSVVSRVIKNDKACPVSWISMG